MDVHKGLRVAIHEREPGALHMDHEAMTPAEGVKHIRHGEFNFRGLSGFEGRGLLEAVAEFAAENIAPHELLIAAHPNMSGIWIRIGKIIGVNVYDFHDPI